MRILVGTGLGEPDYSSNKSLIWAFRQLGVDVCVAGAPYWDRGEDWADILLEDKPFPEQWTYKEILDKAPWTPDLFLQISPHFWITGEKPKEIRSAFYSTDQHADGGMFVQGAKWGNFDYLFVGQPAYVHFFHDLAPNVHVVLPAFDERRFYKNINNEPECDLTFVGFSGLNFPWKQEQFRKELSNYWKKDEIGWYFTNFHELFSPLDLSRFANGPPSFDYAERGELLLRLSRDFDVRVYEYLWNNKIQAAIQKGRIGFNHSLLQDLSIRVWENLASARIPVTDYNDGVAVDEELIMGHEWLFVNLYSPCKYRPFYLNFSLAYENVKKVVLETLENKQLGEYQERARDWAFEYSTWTCRAQQILSLVGA